MTAIKLTVAALATVAICLSLLRPFIIRDWSGRLVFTKDFYAALICILICGALIIAEKIL